MTKILTILPRGIEGCGVTLNSIKFTEYVNSLSGHEAACLANTDIKWGREKAHEGSIVQLSFTEQLDDVKTMIDKYDKIIVMCMPVKKSSEAIKESFVEVLKYIKSKNKFCAYCQFDHRIRSLMRNMYFEEKYFGIWKKYFDVIFNHSHTNDFVEKYIKKFNIEYNKLICRGDYGIVNLFAIDFEDLRNRFYKPFEQKTPKTIKFIGRDIGWKGPYLFRDIHYKHLMDKGWLSTAEGIGLTIGTLTEIYKELTPVKIARDDVSVDYAKALKRNKEAIDNGTAVLKAGKPIYFMPPYIHDRAMERLSKCQFGIEMLLLDDNFCKDVIENAMFEIVAVGCIPIFRKHWADNFEILGKKLSVNSQESIGTVFLDEDDPEPAVELLERLATDKEMYDTWRENAYAFYSKHFDVRSVYAKLLEVIEQNS